MKIIVNPCAGSGKGRKFFPVLQEKAAKRKTRFDIQFSEDAAHATSLARQARDENYDAIVACGGDGTTHHLLPALVGASTPMGVIPVGRGNDFPRNLGIPEDPDAALDVLEAGRLRKIDVIQVNTDQYMIGVGGTGFDSEVNALANNLNGYLKGRMAYVMPALYKMLTYAPKTISVEMTDKKMRGPALMVAFGNIKSYGKGMQITPSAEPDDGLLDVCWVDPVKKLRLYRFFPTVFSGKHLTLPEVHYYQTPSLRVETSVPMELYGDGEFICRTPFTMRVLPKSLLLLVP